MSSKSNNPYKRAGRNGSSARHRPEGGEDANVETNNNNDNNNNNAQQPIVNQRRQRRLPVENKNSISNNDITNNEHKNNNKNLGFDIGNIFPQELLLLNNNNNNDQKQQQPQIQQQQQLQQPSNSDIRNALAVLRRLRETVNNNVTNNNTTTTMKNDTTGTSSNNKNSNSNEHNNNNENANANAKAGNDDDDDNNNNEFADWLKELDGDFGNVYENQNANKKAAEEDNDNDSDDDDDTNDDDDDDEGDDYDDDNPANHNNNNNNIQRDGEEDEEAEGAVPPNDNDNPNDVDNNDDDDNDDNNNDNNNNNNNHFDGGVAEVDDREIESTTADIVLFLTCSEEIAFFPNHPILRPGVCVQIGLGKACLLRSVFQRYVDFCNEQQEKVFTKQNKKRDAATSTSTRRFRNTADGMGSSGSKHRKRNNSKNTKVTSSGKNSNKTNRGTTGSSGGGGGSVANTGGSTYPIVKVEHLEFLHCTVLSGDDTAENAALMKNDRLTVQYERSAERQRDASFHEKHRKSDKIYFEQLRSIVVPHYQIERPTTTSSTSILKSGASKKVFIPATTDSADAVLVCEGRLHPSQVDKFLYQNGISNTSSSTKEKHSSIEGTSLSVKCDSYIVSKRCQWLGHIIQQARVDAQLKKIQLQQQQQKEAEEQKRKEQLLREQNQNDMVEDDADNGVVVEEDDDDPIELSRQSVITIPDIVYGQPIQQQQQQQYDHGQLVVVDDVLSQQEQQIVVGGNEVQADAVGRHDQWISLGSNEDLDDYEMEVLNNNSNNIHNVAAVNRNVNNVPPVLQGIVDDVVLVPVPAAQIVASDEEDFGNGRNLAMQRLVSGSATGAGMKTDNTSGAINNVIDVATDMPVSRNITESSSDEAASAEDNSTLLIVPIKDHSPEAMMLLVEYCYTNRVVALGFEAFSKSCRTKPFSKSKRESATHAATNMATWPVSPFSSSKEMSTPAISFAVAVAGISLGEQAKMNRFSFMCEIAAAQLVTSIQLAIVALKMCEEHNELYKNPLPRLREAAMYRIFMSRNSIDSVVFPALVTEDSNKLLVSPLLMGIVDVIEKSNKAHDKNDNSPGTHHHSNSKANRKKSAWPWPTSHHQQQNHHHHSNDPTLDSNNRNGSSDDLQVFMSHIDLEEAAERDRERYKRRYDKLKQLSSIGFSSNNEPPLSPTKTSNKRQCTTAALLLSSSVTDTVSVQVPSSKVFSFGSRENTVPTFGNAKDGSTNNTAINNSSSNINNNSNNAVSSIAALRSQTLLRMAGHHFPPQPYVFNSSFEVIVPPSRFAPAAPSPLRQSSSVQYESLSPYNATAENTSTVAGSTSTGTATAAAAAASNVSQATINNISNRDTRNKNSNSTSTGSSSGTSNNNNNAPYKRSNHRRKLP